MHSESMLRSGLPVQVGSFALGKAGRASYSDVGTFKKKLAEHAVAAMGSMH